MLHTFLRLFFSTVMNILEKALLIPDGLMISFGPHSPREGHSCPRQHLLPGLHHAGRVRQDVDVLVLVVLVDPGARFEEGLHEEVQEGRHPDLQRTHALGGAGTALRSRGGGAEGRPHRTLQPLQGAWAPWGTGRPGRAQRHVSGNLHALTFQNHPSHRHRGCLASLQEGKATHELNRRRVHACKHLEQDCDVSWVQGSFGQHGPEGLASPGVGGGRAQCQRDLTGVVASW